MIATRRSRTRPRSSHLRMVDGAEDSVDSVEVIAPIYDADAPVCIEAARVTLTYGARIRGVIDGRRWEHQFILSIYAH